MNLGRKYENEFQKIARVDYAKYTYKILVFSKPMRIANIRYKHLICLNLQQHICVYILI